MGEERKQGKKNEDNEKRGSNLHKSLRGDGLLAVSTTEIRLSDHRNGCHRLKKKSYFALRWNFAGLNCGHRWRGLRLHLRRHWWNRGDSTSVRALSLVLQYLIQNRAGFLSADVAEVIDGLPADIVILMSLCNLAEELHGLLGADGGDGVEDILKRF